MFVISKLVVNPVVMSTIPGKPTVALRVKEFPMDTLSVKTLALKCGVHKQGSLLVTVKLAEVVSLYEFVNVT